MKLPLPTRREVLEFFACCAIGLLFGVMLALGYFADAPAWLR